ncbi:MAG TPA: penicillin-binding protein 2 [Candidatus Andersenbacteria bacterium]|nr:MAG: penicillin-binding protein 2 [Candidatus Andersenbacteria bacterium RIFCSPLOWO2_02_FULL_46_11]HBE90912.1 penicillin-binding protein 2 [Candidatus Andersenbacteria bacterium]
MGILNRLTDSAARRKQLRPSNTTLSMIDSFTTTVAKRVMRLKLLRIILVCAVAILLGRSYYLQVIQGTTWHVQAEENRVSITLQAAPRGIVYDRFGRQVVENIASTDLVLDPLYMPNQENESGLIEGLVKYTDLEPTQAREAIHLARGNIQPVLLKKSLIHEVVIELERALKELPGAKLASASVRNYLKPHAMSHVLGYTGLASAEEMVNNNSLIMNDLVGKSGIERKYDQELRGRSGAAYVEVNADGQPQKELSQVAPEPGNDLVLTLDADLQEFIFNLLAENKRRGAVIALDPSSGAVLALVNYPTYDPNVFSQPARQDESRSVLLDAQQPLFNRAIGGKYPPGSTIKPLIAAAGLEEKLITSQTTVLSSGGIQIGAWNFPDWKAGGHGQTNVTKAIAESVNTFFYLLVGGDETKEGLGVRKITKYLNYFAWGKQTGIDLPGETAGLLPSPEWKMETKNEPWYIGDTYHLGIGQGDVLVSPLQVAVSTAAIANGGIVYTPYVVAEQTRGGKTISTHKEHSTKLPISLNNLKIVQQGMRQAVQEGSARRLNSLPIALAGKTGTAQLDSREDITHAWFTSYGPIESPNLVITVLLEEGGKGDVDAIPVAEEIWQWWIEHVK